MKSTAVVICALTAAVILAVFQNCAPALPLDGVVDSSSAHVRATATPGGGAPTGITTGTVYTGSQYDGVCTWLPTDDAMAQAGTDGNGNLIAFNNPSTGKAAIWNVASAQNSLTRASVCSLSLTGYSIQAIGDFNGDLYKDILWRNNSTGDAIVWLMNGSTRYQTGSVANISPVYNIEGVADIDGDGKDDLILRDASLNIVIGQMNGLTAPPTFTTLATHPTASQSIQAISTWYDASTAKRRPAIFFTDTTGVAGTPEAHPIWYLNGTTVTVGSLPSGFMSGSKTVSGVTTAFTYNVIGIGDFDGDANADILLQDPSTLAVRMRFSLYSGGLAVSTRSDSADFSFPTTWTLQGVQKVNGDPIADLLWIVSGGTLPILEFSPVAAAPTNPSYLKEIQSGYTLFKYSHL